MRQVISTAIVALVIGAAAGATMGAVAQSEPARESAITPAATSINADRVDGKHAVGFTSKAYVRKNKLVATNKYGQLPSNIVRPLWGLVKNKPAGFADGVDNEGVTGVIVTTVSGVSANVAAGGWNSSVATCPAGAKVVGGGWIPGDQDLNIYNSTPAASDKWQVFAKNNSASISSIRAYAMCLTIEPKVTASVAKKGAVPSSRRGVATD